MKRKLIEHDIPLAEISKASAGEKSIRTHEDGTLAETRYIEVKARARSGAVRISSNEWKKAHYFGEGFWLYIVTRAKTDDVELHRIQDPTTHFRIEDDIHATGYIVQEDTWHGRTNS
jgi:hypothetical protein